MGLQNARSINSVGKTARITAELIFHDLDLLVLTETWQRFDTDLPIKELTLDGYSNIFKIRPNDRIGSGIAIIFRTLFLHKVTNLPYFTSFEQLTVRYARQSHSFTISVIYRPPSSSHATFLDEFDAFLECCYDVKNHVIMGDFNLHIDDSDNSAARAFVEILDNHNLEQFVRGATHSAGHTLDLIIAHPSDNIISAISVHDVAISDHSLILSKLNIGKSPERTTCLKYRNWKSLDVNLFGTTIENSILYDNYFMIDDLDTNTLVDLYDSTLSTIIDDVLPLITRPVTFRPSSTWYTRQITLAKRERRRLERIWRNSRTRADRQNYTAQRNYVSSLVYLAKYNYYNNFVKENSSSSTTLWNSVKTLLQKRNKRTLPSFTDPTDCANDFLSFFNTKIDHIRNSLPQSCLRRDYVPISEPSFSSFEPATLDEIVKLLDNINDKSCALDPIPSWLVKKLSCTFAPIFQRIVNVSLTTGSFPTPVKTAIITPLLKKQGLDAECLANYRPVSSLPFLSKLIEKVVASRLREHLQRYSLLSPFQSAYRPHFSTETALTKFYNDLARASDVGDISIVIFLDLSAAFDTVDYNILLSRLDARFGLNDIVLDWFRAYLNGRYQMVSIDGMRSRSSHLDFGVPQGSILGPILYSMYTTPISDIIVEYGLKHQIFADDTTVYISLTVTDLTLNINRLDQCLLHLQDWFSSNFLKLNSQKTELFICASRHNLTLINTTEVSLLGNILPLSNTAQSLGVTFDSVLSFEAHVNNIRRKSFFQIRNLRRIRDYITDECAAQITHAFIMCNLDYCNAVLAGCTDTRLKRLQTIQNACARFVRRIPRSQHDLSHIFKELHWLPIKFRIKYKLSCMVHRCLFGDSPDYLKELLQAAPSSTIPILLRSQSAVELYCPRAHHTRCGAFSICGPHEWNSLPAYIRNMTNFEMFKKNLKTFLFRFV